MGRRGSILRVIDPFLLVLGAVVLVGVGVLIAYLHGGGPPPDVKMGPGTMGGEHMSGQHMGGE